MDGHIEEAKILFNDAIKEYDEAANRSGVNFCYDRADVHATLGNIPEALAILKEESCDIGIGLERYILIDPLFKNLWENEAFQKIVKKRQEEKNRIKNSISVYKD